MRPWTPHARTTNTLNASTWQVRVRVERPKTEGMKTLADFMRDRKKSEPKKPN